MSTENEREKYRIFPVTREHWDRGRELTKGRVGYYGNQCAVALAYHEKYGGPGVEVTREEIRQGHETWELTKDGRALVNEFDAGKDPEDIDFPILLTVSRSPFSKNTTLLSRMVFKTSLDR